MKKYLILFFLLFIVSSLSFAGDEKTVFYILPKGQPYGVPRINSNQNRSISLQFGEKLRVVETITIQGISWYRCQKGLYYFYLPEMFVTHKSKYMKKDQSGNIMIGYGIVDKEHALPLNYRPNDLVQVHASCKADGYEWREMLLRQEAVEIFERLIDDAERDDISIRILSAFRNAKYQSYLYYDAIKRRGVFQIGVAKPGHSEHQLGTVCDLTSDEIRNTLSTRFENTLAYRWLMDHIADYGIDLSYPKNKARVTGYIYEPWHYRYWGGAIWSRGHRGFSLNTTNNLFM